MSKDFYRFIFCVLSALLSQWRNRNIASWKRSDTASSKIFVAVVFIFVPCFIEPLPADAWELLPKGYSGFSVFGVLQMKTAKINFPGIGQSRNSTMEGTSEVISCLDEALSSFVFSV